MSGIRLSGTRLSGASGAAFAAGHMLHSAALVSAARPAGQSLQRLLPTVAKAPTVQSSHYPLLGGAAYAAGRMLHSAALVSATRPVGRSLQGLPFAAAKAPTM